MIMSWVRDIKLWEKPIWEKTMNSPMKPMNAKRSFLLSKYSSIPPWANSHGKSGKQDQICRTAHMASPVTLYPFPLRTLAAPM